MRLFKRTLSIITVLSLAFSVPVMAEGEGEIAEGETRLDITKFAEIYDMEDEKLFTVNEKGVITAVDEKLKEKKYIVIPDTVKNEQGEEIAITGLGDGSFKDMVNLEKIYLPDSIDTFGKECFRGDVNLENMLPYYEEQVFVKGDYNKLMAEKEKEEEELLTTEVGNRKVGVLNREEGDPIYLPLLPIEGNNNNNEEEEEYDTTKAVGYEYMGDVEEHPYYNLPGFYLPKSLVNVDGSAFIGCEKITGFKYDYSKRSEHELPFDMGGESYELLVTIDHKKVVCLAPGFSGDMYDFAKELSSDLIEEIGPYACYNSKVNNGFIIPNSVKTIGEYAFYGCTNQHVFTIAEGSVLENVGEWAFANTVNLNIKLPETVKTIGAHVFDAANNAVIDISATQIETIPEYAFANQPTLHEITAPKTLKTIEPYAFANSENLDTVNFLGESLESIGKGAFEGCRTLHVINIPEGVKVIEEDTFSGCGNLGIIVLPESLEEIGANAFKDCVTIHEMVIPEGVKKIDPTSFSGAKIDNIDTSKNAVLAKMFGRYKEPVETDEQKAAKLLNKVITIGKFKYLVTKTDKTGGEVKLIGAANKKAKKSLKKLNVAAKVNYTFEGKKFTYKVTAVGNNAFKGYKKLAKVTIGANVKTIGKKAFFGCKKLKRVNIKTKKVIKIGKKAFKRKGGKKITFKVAKKLKKKFKKALKRAKTNKFKVK